MLENKNKNHMDVKAKVHWPKEAGWGGGVGGWSLLNIQAHCLCTCFCASNCFPFSALTH